MILGALKSTPLENSSGRALFSGARYALPAPQEKVPPTDMLAIENRWTEFVSLAPDCGKNDGGSGEKRRTTAMKNKLRRRLFYGEEAAKFLFGNVAGIALPTARHILEKAKERGVSQKTSLRFSCVFTRKRKPTRIFQKAKADTTTFCFPDRRRGKAGSLNDAEAKYYVSRSENRAFGEKRRNLPP